GGFGFRVWGAVSCYTSLQGRAGWPLEGQGVLGFGEGLDHVLVVGGKGDFIEAQLKSLLYGRVCQPSIVGKRDFDQAALIPSSGQLSPSIVKRALLRWLEHCDDGFSVQTDAVQQSIVTPTVRPLHSFGLTRRPY